MRQRDQKTSAIDNERPEEFLSSEILYVCLAVASQT